MRNATKAMPRVVLGACFVAFGGALAGACGVDGVVLRDPEGGETPIDTLPPAFRDGGIDEGPAVVDVFLGQDITCALALGRAFCWGKNERGSLGTGDTNDRTSPTPVATDVRFDALAIGNNHVCGLESATGNVFCWGDGSYGQLGQGDLAPRSTPAPVSLPSPAAQITAGYEHTCAVLRDGTLHCWGDNTEGQLGLQPDGNRDRPTRIGDGTDWVQIAGGQGHTCGLRRPGQLWCWGRDTEGQLGDGYPQAPENNQKRTPIRIGDDLWLAIDLGQDQGCGIATDGSLRCWGTGEYGNLGDERIIYGVPTAVGTRRDWIKVRLDVFDTCAVTTSQQLFCWGRNAEGQLGLDDYVDRDSPTQIDPATKWTSVGVGRFHVCGVTNARTIRCAGDNPFGQLGVGDRDRRAVLTEAPLPAGATPLP